MSSVPSVTDAVNRAPPAGPTGMVPAGERRPRRRWVALVPAAVGGSLMLTVALVRADRPVLSWDEVTTADVAQRSPGQIWHLLQNVDAVFGAYYFVMRWWTGLAGTSELALRLPSIVAMAAAVALAAELGRRLFGPLIGTTTGLILCLVPNTSRYAAEARPYAFTCLFSVLAVLVTCCSPRWPSRPAPGRSRSCSPARAPTPRPAPPPCSTSAARCWWPAPAPPPRPPCRRPRSTATAASTGWSTWTTSRRC